MAAFSYQELPFLVDCVLTPDMMMKLSSSSSSSTITSPLLSPSCCFSEDQPPHHLLTSNSSYPEPIFHGDQQLQFQYPYGSFPQEEFKPIDFSLHDSSCVEQGTPLAIAQSTPASSDNGGGGTLSCNPVNNKRKPKGDGSSPNPSKGLRGGRSKKQKKTNNGGVKKEKVEEEEDDEEPKKTQSPSPTAANEAPKGYIHVRARRGQATDSHSLAERARREKISERMKLLQALVPGCDKVTGKATMLDEIINYVRSLQTQVEFLSMKLTSLNPMVYNFGLDLDALLLGQQQVLNNTAAPPVGLLQQCSQSSTNPTTETPATAAATTGMPTLVQQQEQRGAIPSCLEDDIGSLYWGLGGQGGPDPVNQTGFGSNNNMMY